MSTKQDYIIMVTDELNTRYVVRKGKNVSLQTGTETPLALSYLVGDESTLLKWNLENALDGSEAMRMISAVLDVRYKDAPPNVKPRMKILGVRKPL